MSIVIRFFGITHLFSIEIYAISTIFYYYMYKKMITLLKFQKNDVIIYLISITIFNQQSKKMVNRYDS